MKMHPTLVLSGMAAGAVAAAIALSPNASAQPNAQSCHVIGQARSVCQSPGNYEGDFSQPIHQPSPYEYPYGWLQAL